MAKTVRNVMFAIPKDKQISGMTLEEIRTAFLLAGYGGTKANKRTKELLVSAQIQYTGADTARGEMLFFCVYWPYASKKVNYDRVGSYEYLDNRHTMIARKDRLIDAWNLTKEPDKMTHSPAEIARSLL